MKPVVGGKKTFRGVLIASVNIAGSRERYVGTMRKANLFLLLPQFLMSVFRGDAF